MKPYTEKFFSSKSNFITMFNNYFAFFLKVLFGFLIVALILNYTNMSYLGVFTQTYTILFIAAQLSVTGLNDSILKKLSTLSNHENESKLIANVLLAALINAFLFSCVFYFFHEQLFSIFQSEKVVASNTFIYVAIFFSTINKVFLSILQGKKLLNSFAFFIFVRPFLIFLFIFFSLIKDIDINFSVVFSLAEIIIFILLSIKINLIKITKLSLLNINYVKKHYSFGFKVFFNSFMSESFIRIDILMIAILLNDKMVGIYSLASLFFEGIYQFSIVIRNVINPEIGRLYKNKNYISLIKLIRHSTLLSFFVVLIVSLIVFLLIPYILFFLDIHFIDKTLNLVKFLLIGLIFYSLIIPSENLLFQSNNPGAQSVYMSSLVLLNIILNYLMITRYGLIGAAIGTAIVYTSSILIYNLYVIYVTNLNRGIYFYNVNNKN